MPAPFFEHAKSVVMPDREFMRRAIDKAKEGISQSQLPFGACIVKDGVMVSCAHNTIWKDMNIAAHAETNAIREACNKLNTVDLSGCTIYSTCEPCTMCFGACALANIGRIVYGADAEYSNIDGFHVLDISNEELNRIGKGNVEIVKDCLKEECLELFKLWELRKK